MSFADELNEIDTKKIESEKEKRRYEEDERKRRYNCDCFERGLKESFIRLKKKNLLNTAHIEGIIFEQSSWGYQESREYLEFYLCRIEDITSKKTNLGRDDYRIRHDAYNDKKKNVSSWNHYYVSIDDAVNILKRMGFKNVSYEIIKIPIVDKDAMIGLFNIVKGYEETYFFSFDLK